MDNYGKIYIGFDSSGLFKIGITKDEKKRLVQYKVNNPTFHYLWVFPAKNPAVLEIELHTKFKEGWETGEWFDLSPDDLAWIYRRLGGTNNYGEFEFKALWDFIRNRKEAGNYGWIDFERRTGKE